MTAIKNISLTAFSLLMVLFSATDADAQCRTFTKKRCLPQLEDYVQNDNYNTAVLIPGDEAELELTFFGDRAYRLLVCGHPVLGDLTFQVLDSRGNGIYDSKDKESNHFDFRVANTQQMTVRVQVPRPMQSLNTKGASASWSVPKADPSFSTARNARSVMPVGRFSCLAVEEVRHGFRNAAGCSAWSQCPASRQLR